MPKKPASTDKNFIAHDDMLRAVEIASIIRDTRRRPRRSRLAIAQMLIIYCAVIVRDDPQASLLLRERLLEVADDLATHATIE
jgi:hypothetical protein